MTDKQIKEGIDVSQCECYSIEYNSCNKTLSGSCMKEKCQTFRLLQTIKAKEQECEELKSDLTDLSKIIDCKNGTILTFKEQLDQLKADNEELKRQHQGDKGLITSTGKMNYQLIQEYDKLKADNEELKRQHQGDKGLITSTGKMNYQLIQEYDKLKAENEELKEELSVIQHNCSREGCKYYDDDTFKVFYECKAQKALQLSANSVTTKYCDLLKTLAEIKEIMKKHCRKCKKHKFYYFQLCYTCKYIDILQKISECEVE